MLEATSGITAVRKRVEYFFNNLKDKSLGPVDRACDSFMVACTLAFDLDKRARVYVYHAPMYKSTVWPQFPPGEEGDSIAWVLVRYLTARGDDSLSLGLSTLQCVSWNIWIRKPFLTHPPRAIIRSDLRVDLNMLCYLAERLTGLFVMAHNVDPKWRAPHEAALPRGWFINLIHPGIDLDKDTSTFLTFGSTIIDLLREVDTQVQKYPDPAANERFIAGFGRVTDWTGPLYLSRM